MFFKSAVLKLAFFEKKLRRFTNSEKYVAEIDGIRFLAIAAVVIFHSCGFYVVKMGLPVNDFFNQHLLGYKGVHVFFVLSGFVISMPFAKGLRKVKPEFQIKNYYLRRLSRIEPPYVISTVAIFYFLVFVQHKYTFAALFPYLIYSLTYTTHFFSDSLPIINMVLWTLEIEIQFYLLAPFICYFIFGVVANKNIRLIILSAAIISSSLLTYFFHLNQQTLLHNLNLFLAGLFITEFILQAPRFTINKTVTDIVCFLLLLIIFSNSCEWYSAVYAALYSFVFILFFVLVLLKGGIHTFLQNKFVTIIGGGCYSIYLIHTQIISLVGERILSVRFTPYYYLNELICLMVFIACILPVALFFFVLVERPCMDKRWPNKLYAYVKKYTVKTIK